ncbi:MAG TPA: hypothetical protein VH680_00080 [Gemmatimonadales bacterium]|jgi:hypothetical protein
MRQLVLVASLLAAVGAGPTATAQEPARRNDPAVGTVDDEAWPRELRDGIEVFTIYQPQLDAWNGLQLEGQAAVSLRIGEGAPTFGVMWFTARTQVNKPARLVTLENLTITKTRFPSAPDKAEAYRERLRARLASAPKLIALDLLEADLAILTAGRKADALPVRNDPPRILFSSVPAVLVLVDGPPVYQPIQGTNLQRVVNTRPLLLRDPGGKHFLHVFDGWLQAPGLEGPWVPEQTASLELEIARRQAVAAGVVDLLQGSMPADSQDAKPSLAKGPVPAVYPATTPTELIVTEGEPNWVPIGGQTQLLYVKNTTGHVFKHLGDQQTYLLISGRWFRAPIQNGPWEFVSSDALPADFARIPDNSPKENVKASVAGTPQAEEALIANSIPQTAKVDRARAQLTAPKYDGEPQLRAIEGTSLQYVANTTTPIIVVAPGAYFAVENGVWFTASVLAGPWRVAAAVPAVIYSIPPSSPLHYVTYVRVYDATPSVVYVGYTAGYSGTCVSGGVVVYGTGYRYTPWIGVVWYRPPVTYGYGVSVTYTPWTGWTYGFGFGWSAYAPYPYYAPAAWGVAAVGPYGAAAVGPYGGWAATTGNVYSRWGGTTAVSRTSGGYNPWTGNAWASQAGTSYNSRTGVASAGQRAGVENVYTGDYAAAERGVVQGPEGVTAAGGRATVGNTETGRSVTAGRGVVYDPNTGSATSAAGVHGTEGGAGRVGDDVYAGKDGNVYRHGSDGWQQYQDGSWQSVGNSERAGSLEQQRSARGTGESRVQRYNQGSGRTAPSRGSRPRLR